MSDNWEESLPIAERILNTKNVPYPVKKKGGVVPNKAATLDPNMEDFIYEDSVNRNAYNSLLRINSNKRKMDNYRSQLLDASGRMIEDDDNDHMNGEPEYQDTRVPKMKIYPMKNVVYDSDGTPLFYDDIDKRKASAAVEALRLKVEYAVEGTRIDSDSIDVARKLLYQRNTSKLRKLFDKVLIFLQLKKKDSI